MTDLGHESHPFMVWLSTHVDSSSLAMLGGIRGAAQRCMEDGRCECEYKGECVRCIAADYIAQGRPIDIAPPRPYCAHCDQFYAAHWCPSCGEADHDEC